MPREASKCRKWEKDRRNRLNEGFAGLVKVLPCYDPSKNLSKIEILAKATKFILELQGKVKEQLTADTDNKPEQAELKQLYLRVKQLLSRNEQLSNLLRDAGISIPNECGSIKMCKPKKWAGKISQEKAELLAKMEAQKENEPKETIKVKKPPKKTTIKKVKPKAKKVTVEAPPKQVVTIANIQPCYFIASSVAGKLTKTTSVTNLVTAPILSTQAKPTNVITKPSTGTFPSGTLIFTNNIQTTPILNPAPIILNAGPSNAVIVVNKNETAKSSVTKGTTIASKTLPALMPKRIVTRTTHVNKVPIPASRYASNYILLASNSPRFVKTKRRIKRVKPVENKKVEDDGGSSGKGDDNVDEEVKKTDYTIDSICKEKEKAEEIPVPAPPTPPPPTPPAPVLPPEPSPPPPVIPSPPPQPEITQKLEIEDKKVAEEKVEKQRIITETISELSNDIFASLQVPSGSQNPESTSPTAAFLNAFPLVSSFTGVKVSEVMEEETSDSPHGTPTLLQIGTMDTAKPTQTTSPSLLNLDNFSFFTGKEMNLYQTLDNLSHAPAPAANKMQKDLITKTAKILYDNAVSDTTAPQLEVKSKAQPVFYPDNTNYPESGRPKEKAAASCSKYTTYNIPEYNTFNPFTDIPKANYNQQNKSYSNCTNYSYNEFGYKKGDKCYYENNQCYAAPKPPVNWMTTPDVKQHLQQPQQNHHQNHNQLHHDQQQQQSHQQQQPQQQTDFIPFAKDTEFVAGYSQNPQTYFNGTTAVPLYQSVDYTDQPKTHQEQQDHQFAWSPTKLPQLMDPQHGFVSTTLPTLVGDLALGNPYLDKSKPKQKERKQVSYDNVANFLSVSELVNHNKPEASRVSARRNSGSRGKNPKKRSSRSDKVKANNPHFDIPDWLSETKRLKGVAAPAPPPPPSNYSAEALIAQNKQNSYVSKASALPVPFLTDISYFPAENNFTNDNYQNTFPSNSYSGSFIPNSTSYLPTSNFMPDIPPPPPPTTDFIPENIFSKPMPEVKQQHRQTSNGGTKSNNKLFLNPRKSAASVSRKKPVPETNSFVDFSFLPMQGSINSPILPDDFHSNFLPPNHNQLYSCKNPLYQASKQPDLGGSLLPPLTTQVSRSNIQHPEISPSLNTVGTSLTNFNLSTIFPEINKPMSDVFLDPSKNSSRNYLSSATTQLPLPKGPIYSSVTTQSFVNS